MWNQSQWHERGNYERHKKTWRKGATMREIERVLLAVVVFCFLWVTSVYAGLPGSWIQHPWISKHTEKIIQTLDPFMVEFKGKTIVRYEYYEDDPPPQPFYIGFIDGFRVVPSFSGDSVLVALREVCPHEFTKTQFPKNLGGEVFWEADIKITSSNVFAAAIVHDWTNVYDGLRGGTLQSAGGVYDWIIGDITKLMNEGICRDINDGNLCFDLLWADILSSGPTAREIELGAADDILIRCP